MRTYICSAFSLLVIAIAASLVPTACHAQSGMVSTVLAERLGLERAWFSQAQIDFGRYRIEKALLQGDHLFVLAESGVLHAMEAETGKTAWIARLGNPAYPSLGPAANGEFVAVVNGSELYLIDQKTGVEKAMHELGGGPGGGPAITSKYAYVPMFTGRLEAYPTGEPRDIPWYYASTGRVFDAPTATPESLVWPTDRGYLYVANPEANGIRYRFESSGRIIGGPSSVEGVLYIASSNGYLYAINEMDGQQLWRYSAGASVNEPPLVVAGVAYLPTDEPALHAVNLSTGELKWTSPGVAKMAGVSQSRVYGLDRLGRLMVIDGASGVGLGLLPSNLSMMPVVNAVNDRIYLVSETGLVQCLREIGSDKPYIHSTTAAPVEPAEDGGQDPAPDRQDPQDGGDDQPEPEGQPAPNPFEAGGGDEDDNPFGGFGGDDDDNPFGF